jgi:hypothetical protein
MRPLERIKSRPDADDERVSPMSSAKIGCRYETHPGRFGLGGT